MKMNTLIKTGLLICSLSLVGCMQTNTFRVDDTKDLTMQIEGMVEAEFEEVMFDPAMELHEDDLIRMLGVMDSNVYYAVESDTGIRKEEFYNSLRTKSLYTYNLENESLNKIYNGKDCDVYDAVRLDYADVILSSVYQGDDDCSMQYEIIELNENNEEVLKEGMYGYFKPMMIPLKNPIVMVPTNVEDSTYYGKYPCSMLEFYEFKQEGLVKLDVKFDDKYQLLGMDCCWNDTSFVLFLLNTETETAEFGIIEPNKQVRYVPFPKECRFYNFGMIGDNLFVCCDDTESGFTNALLYDFKENSLYKGEMDRVYRMHSMPSRDAVITIRSSGGIEYCELFTYNDGVLNKVSTKVLSQFEPHRTQYFIDGDEVFVYIENQDLDEGEKHLYKLTGF